MLRKLSTLFFTLILTISMVSAKNILTITGKVVEKGSKSALSFATVILQTNDNQILGGTTTSIDGSFVLKNDNAAKCALKVSFIGFKDTTMILRDISGDVDLGTIELSEDKAVLKSAVITAKVPVIEQKMDKLVMNVAEAVSTDGSNAMDILKRAPGVSVDPSGNIKLNGSNVQIWIDGRPSNISGSDLESLLSGTEGSSIDKIEIISHPSARYDASGSGGIINIRTRKNFAQGLSGTIRGSYMAAPYKQKYYEGYDGSVMLNLRSEKVNSTLSFSPRYYEGFNTFDTETQVTGGSMIKSHTHMYRPNEGVNLKFSTDYHIDKKNIIGFVVGGMWREYQDMTDNNTGSILYADGHPAEVTASIINNDIYFDNVSANLNYTHFFENKAEITFNADHYNYKSGRLSYQENNYTTPGSTSQKSPLIFESDSDQGISIYSFKADFESEVFNGGKVEAGIKVARSITDNNLIWRDKIGDQWETAPQKGTLFDYSENISASYISLGGQITPKLTLKGGIRAEFTSSKGEWYSADTTTNKNYVDFFPTLFIGYNPNEKARIGLSFSSRIERPGYEELNPQKYHIDATSSGMGNPELQPQYANQASLSLSLGNHFHFSLNGTTIRNAKVQMPYFTNSVQEKTLYWDNFGKSIIAGINLSVTEYPVRKWLLANANLNNSFWETKHPGFYRNSFVTQGNLNFTFLLPDNLKAELSGWFQGKTPYGLFELEPVADLTLGIKKGMFENKGTLSLVATDILRTNKSRVNLEKNESINPGLEFYKFESQYRSSRITLNFQYRFGKGKAYKQRRVGTIEETSRVSGGN